MNYTYEYGECQNHNTQGDSFSAELNAWFLVSGDTDDFIFFGEDERPHSEK